MCVCVCVLMVCADGVCGGVVMAVSVMMETVVCVW